MNSEFLFTVLFSVFIFKDFSTVTCPLLSWYWKCFSTYYAFILVELLMMVMIKMAHLMYVECELWVNMAF